MVINKNHIPSISIIVPNYNHEQFLDERINSILTQSFQDFELILLDDASTDNSKNIISKYSTDPHVSIIDFATKNSGKPFSQWYKGVSYAKAEWIWIAESDDTANKYFLETLLSAADKYPSAGLIYSHLQWINSDGELLYSQDDLDNICFYNGDDFAKTKLLFSTTIFNVSSCIFKKEVYNQINHQLYTHMKMCGDYYLYTLFSQITDIVEVGNVLDSYRVHNNNTSIVLSRRGSHWKEQMPILDFICKRYSIPQKKYAHHYARIIINDKYSFSDTIGILKHFIPKHSLVILYWIVLSVKDFFKRVPTIIRRGTK